MKSVEEMEEILTKAVKASKLETILDEKRDAYVADATGGKYKSFKALKEAKGEMRLKEVAEKKKVAAEKDAQDKLKQAEKMKAEAEAVLKKASPQKEAAK